MKTERERKGGMEGEEGRKKQELSSPGQLLYNLLLWEHLEELKIKNKETGRSPCSYFLGSEKATAIPYVTLVCFAS